MRISDWSSDVCSSDLPGGRLCSGNAWEELGGNLRSGNRIVAVPASADERVGSLTRYDPRRAVRVDILLRQSDRARSHRGQEIRRFQNVVICLATEKDVIKDAWFEMLIEIGRIAWNVDAEALRRIEQLCAINHAPCRIVQDLRHRENSLGRDRKRVV